MDWTSVKDAPLPVDNATYLVADMERGFVAPYMRGFIHNNAGTMNDWQWGATISHWMPLPPPPKGGE